MEVATATAIITDMVSDITDVLAAGLPLVLGFIGVLIGLFFVVRFIYKKIGRAKG